MDWQEKYKHKITTADEAVKHIKSGDRIVLQEGQILSEYIVDALMKNAHNLKDIHVFSSVCYCEEKFVEPEYYPNFQTHCCFLSMNTRKAYKDGRIIYTPLVFSDYPRWIKEQFKPNVFIINVTPPDENGYCSFSLCGDWCTAAAECCNTIIAQINNLLPRTNGSEIHIDKITHLIPKDTPLKDVVMGRPGEVESKIGGFIAPLIKDGDCLQMGIGGIPDTVLSLLHDKKDLGAHTELLTDGFVDLYESGAITNANKNVYQGKITTTFAVGTKRLFDFIDNNPNVVMLPVDYINNPIVIAQNDNVVSVNSCLQIDLYGQVNSDTINGVPYSGVGGQVDFVKGAALSKGGRSFITLSSTALNGTVSRIVGALDRNTPVTTNRFDIQYVVTEYGIVNIRGLSESERAKAIISIAHPNFREDLERQGRDMGLIK